MNKVILLGRLGADPILRKTQTDQPVTGFSLAIDESYKDRNGQKVDKVLWVKVSVWGKQAETAAKYLKKGRQVLIEGRIQGVEMWTGKQDNETHTMVQITAMGVKFVGNKAESAGQGQAGDSWDNDSAGTSSSAVPDDADIPF